ncbi:LmeA family phospholipid-binding protein [Leptodesmis sp.]|uniref:LmeA family phospholipid-binding protein n=1 Tax=Leptodesmis sp. TaxID=3100501 RepID=UPI00405346AE
MEIFILILSSLISVLSPANFAADKIAESTIRSQFKQVEVLKVRIDNAPVFNVANGKVDKIRIAGRGFFPVEDVRIDTLEVETDPIDVERRQLFDKPTRVVLQRPLGVAARIVITKEDVIRALKSKVVADAIQRLIDSRDRQQDNQPAQPKPPSESSNQPEQNRPPEQPRQPSRLQQIRTRIDQYRVQDPKVEFLPNQRVAVQAEIVDLKTSAVLKIQAETGFDILEQRQIRFTDPTITLNGQPLTAEAARNFADRLAEQLDVKRYAALLNVRAKILKASINEGRLELAGFLQLPAGLRL